MRKSKNKEVGLSALGKSSDIRNRPEKPRFFGSASNRRTKYRRNEKNQKSKTKSNEEAFYENFTITVIL